jgi:hypothetical protein
MDKVLGVAKNSLSKRCARHKGLEELRQESALVSVAEEWYRLETHMTRRVLDYWPSSPPSSSCVQYEEYARINENDSANSIKH